MTSIWRKAVRDFWQERTRTALVVLAIALGIAAFSAVLSAYAILTRELDRGYLATNPASAILRTDRIDDELVAAVLSDQAISDAEPRRVVTGQIKAGPAQWRNLVLFVVKDYGQIHVSKLEPQQGAWPPATGEILIERDAFQVASAKIGDTVRVKTVNGVEQPLFVSGSVHDVGQAQARMENVVYGYITLDTLRQLGEEPFLDQLNILVAENKFDEGHIRSVAEQVRKLVESRGHAVRRVDIPRPGKHPHSDLMGILLLAMSTFGLFVLILSGILVVNLLTALMAAQVRQIGVMKAIGGTRAQIAKIYFGQALLLGIAALILSLPLGMLGSRILCRYMAVFLNFDINSFAVPAWVYLLVAIIGLLGPLCAAAYPVWRGTSVSVLAALGHYGLAHDRFGTNAVDRAMTRVGGPFRPLALAMRNSFRRRARLALTLVTLAAGGLFFMSALNIRASIIGTLDRRFASRKFDLTIVLSEPYPLEKVQRAIQHTSGIARAEGWFTTEGSLGEPTEANVKPATHSGQSGMHTGGAGVERFNVVALPSDTNLLEFDLIAGRKLLVGDTGAIVVNNALAAKSSEIKVGNKIQLKIGPEEASWIVVGIARESFSPPVAYIPRAFMEPRHPGMANTVRMRLTKTDSASINAVKTELDRNLTLENVRAVGSFTKADSRYGFDQHMLMIYVFLVIMSAIIALVGGLGLMTTMTLNVLERRREMGVLRAIGATPFTVWLIIVVEGLVIGILSWALAAVAAWPISKVLGDIIVNTLFTGGLDFTFEPAGVLIWLAISVVVSLGGSFLPAWRASQVTVREALAYE
jgi:putative ABC transport system permease protein